MKLNTIGTQASAAAPTRRRRWLRALIEVAVVLAALAALQAWLTRDVVRGPLPALDGQLLDGRTPAQWQAARPAGTHLVYVWATWCPVCATIRGNVDAVTADWPVLTVAMRSGAPGDVQRHLDQHGLRWHTLNDPQGGASERLGVSAVPMLLFVDRHNEVRWVTRGYTSEAGILARLWLVDAMY